MLSGTAAQDTGERCMVGSCGSGAAHVRHLAVSLLGPTYYSDKNSVSTLLIHVYFRLLRWGDDWGCRACLGSILLPI